VSVGRVLLSAFELRLPVDRHGQVPLTNRPASTGRVAGDRPRSGWPVPFRRTAHHADHIQAAKPPVPAATSASRLATEFGGVWVARAASHMWV